MPDLLSKSSATFGRVYSDLLARHQPHQRRALGINYRVLTVGALRNGYGPVGSGEQGLKVDFSTISEAMNAIPTITDPGAHNFTDRWTILVTTGYYDEDVRLKPFVSVVGLDRDSVVIQSPKDNERFDPGDAQGRRATVYLNYFSQLSNVTIGKRFDSRQTDFTVWNRDTWGVQKVPNDVTERADQFGPLDPSFCGMENISVLCFPDSPTVQSKSILLEGEWRTIFFQRFGTSYRGADGFDVEIRGNGRIADSHFIDCFFDSLFLQGPDAGAIRVDNCIDLHIRNTLVRVGRPVTRAEVGEAFTASALRIVGGANVLLEGTSLKAEGRSNSDRVLDASDGLCEFCHSSTDSVRGRGRVVVKGLPDADTYVPVIPDVYR